MIQVGITILLVCVAVMLFEVSLLVFFRLREFELMTKHREEWLRREQLVDVENQVDAME